MAGPMKALQWTVASTLCAAGVVSACGASAWQAAGGDAADIVFLGGHIVTMEPAQPSVEAVAVRGETIVAAGSRAKVMTLRGEATRVVELGEQALLPGFIDTHGHFLAVGRGLDALSLHPPPVGDVRNIDDVVRKIRAWIAEREIRRAASSSAAATTIPCSPKDGTRRATTSTGRRPRTASC